MFIPGRPLHVSPPAPSTPAPSSPPAPSPPAPPSSQDAPLLQRIQQLEKDLSAANEERQRAQSQLSVIELQQFIEEQKKALKKEEEEGFDALVVGFLLGAGCES